MTSIRTICTEVASDDCGFEKYAGTIREAEALDRLAADIAGLGECGASARIGVRDAQREGAGAGSIPVCGPRAASPSPLRDFLADKMADLLGKYDPHIADRELWLGLFDVWMQQHENTCAIAALEGELIHD